jgi:hypothetical protein
MCTSRRIAVAPALIVATLALFNQAASATSVVECRAIDCSGRQISCPGGNPLTKLLCEQQKATWKAQCEVQKRVCFATSN